MDTNTLTLLLIIVPLIMAVIFLISNNKALYKVLSYLLFVSGAVLSILLAFNGSSKIVFEGSSFGIIETIILVCEIALILFMLWVSVKYKRWGTFCLVLVSIALTIYTQFFTKKVETGVFNIDKLSLVMVLIVNIVGTLILVFANGYISEYEHHRGMKSRQKLFYSVICVFLAAMNGLVLSDSLSWMYFFWEITTVSSFLLISYNKDQEAWNSGFRALFLNLIGGISFAVGIIILNGMDISTLTQVIQHGKSAVLIPVLLLCIAGFAKSAQVPFHSWLLGAMVAPTPVSALLHSSTMVKAGVFLIIKLSPAYSGTMLGYIIAIYGAFSFFLCSAIAISQRNAKRVLAYSTIANLGLIISCAGLGSTIAVSAAILLLIFHAVSKALLFLTTGQIEHTIGSRDIEDMHGLINKAPLLTGIAAFGMFSMLLPPFGVLVSKWLSMEASVTNPLVTLFVVLGSALTTVYYVKWMGTVLTSSVTPVKDKAKPVFTIYFPLLSLCTLATAASIFITQVFDAFVRPEIISLFSSKTNALSITADKVVSPVGSFNDLAVFIALIVAVVGYLFIRKFFVSSAKVKSIYMCGENNIAEDRKSFRNGLGGQSTANVSNMYLVNIFDEKILTKLGYIVSILIIAVAFIGGLQ